MTYSENMQVSYVILDHYEKATATYLFRDIYNEEYWTAPMANVPYEAE